MTATEQPAAPSPGEPTSPEATQWYSLTVDDTVARLGVDASSGLGAAEVDRRLEAYGKNEVATEPPPTTWQMAKLRSPIR